MSDIVIEHPRWHSQDEVNEIRRGHMEAVARLVARIEQLKRENAELLDKVKILEGHLDAAIKDYNEALEAVVSPKEIAAAWSAWQSRHGGKLGPGPAFREAIEAAFVARARRPAEQEGTE